jgi:hypothetical protein
MAMEIVGFTGNMADRLTEIAVLLSVAHNPIESFYDAVRQRIEVCSGLDHTS